jgi:hypothetical protein
MKSKMLSLSGDTWRSVILVPVKAPLEKYQRVLYGTVGNPEIGFFNTPNITLNMRFKNL